MIDRLKAIASESEYTRENEDTPLLVHQRLPQRTWARNHQLIKQQERPRQRLNSGKDRSDTGALGQHNENIRRGHFNRTFYQGNKDNKNNQTTNSEIATISTNTNPNQ
ncbi:unnamed protein product [Didymodactylos carnosus]|uniref:Uncharacterized protein n=1 Tax=Didymodactylos carnosus TaxID=1234261 RepID=A0A8S2ZFC7_9BILA|nr:unnamed protein product [Didymodactylos carnosus]